MNTIYAKCFGFAVLTALSFAAGDAGASVTSFAASACVMTPGTRSHLIVEGQAVNSAALGFGGGGSISITDYCPIVSDSVAFPAKAASSVDVYGWSTEPNSIVVKACRVSVGGWSASCSNPVGSTATGNVDHISVPPANGGGWVSGSDDRDGYYLVITYSVNTAIFNYSFTH